MRGSMAFINKAFLRKLCPTIAEKGYVAVLHPSVIDACIIIYNLYVVNNTYFNYTHTNAVVEIGHGIL